MVVVVIALAMDTPASRSCLRKSFTSSIVRFLTDVQGFNTLNKFKVLTDDEVDHLGLVLRKPGGMIQRQGQEVTHPGFSVSYVAIKQLKLMNYYLRFTSIRTKVDVRRTDEKSP